MEKAFEDKRLFYEMQSSGKVGFFFIYECAMIHEFKEECFRITDCYCIQDPKMRRKFYALIKDISQAVKTLRKTARMVIDVSCEDELSKKHFLKKGKLTSLELVGKTKEGLKALKKEKPVSGLVLAKMTSQDLGALVTLDLASHIFDKTSRMRDMFMRPEGKGMVRSFYRQVLKKKSCFVAKKNGKVVGSICYFIDDKNRQGLVGSIFVANAFKGQGISKILYRKLLEEFDERGLKYYLGSSTTERVLSLASKMKRKEKMSSILLSL